jgi:hypothetical protein
VEKPKAVVIDRRRRAELPESVLGAKQLQPLQHLLDQLHSSSVHGNTRVLDDHVLVLHLLSFYNPVVRSLRLMEDLSQTPTAMKLMGELERVPKSTLSDAHRRVDPAALLPVMKELMTMLPPAMKLTADLAGIKQQILACDATYFQVINDLAWALQNRKSNGKPGARAGLFIQLDVATGTPFGKDGCGVELGDKTQSEAKLAARHIVPGAIHLYDRGFIAFALLSELLKAKADFVLRLTSQTNFTVVEERQLSEPDKAAGILSDRIGCLSGCQHSMPPGQLLREVIVTNDADPAKPLRLLTSLLDLHAHQIAGLYRLRWQIELFFRWFKLYGHYTRLISHNKAGAAWGFYIAVIGVTLMAITSGSRPSVYDLSLLSIVAAGGATLADILPILQRRHRSCELARIASAKRRKSHAASN